MQLPDNDILRRVQQGEREAYLTLFDRHYRRIECYAFRQLHNAEAARDIASETFLRAFRSVDSFRIGEQITYLGYLFLICHRLILTERQRQRATPVVSLDVLNPEDDAPGMPRTEGDSLPLSKLLQAESRAMVRDALGKLSTEDREIIHLAYERDLSRQDIAGILGKPSVSAVTSHLYRAMQKLKTVLIQQGYFRNDQAAEQSVL